MHTICALFYCTRTDSRVCARARYRICGVYLPIVVDGPDAFLFATSRQPHRGHTHPHPGSQPQWGHAMGPSSIRNTRASIVYVAVYRAASIGDFRHVLSCMHGHGDILRQESNAPQNRPTYLLLCSMTCQRPIWMIATAIPTQFHRMVVSTPSLYTAVRLYSRT